MTRTVPLALFASAAIACSGSGVSTTARGDAGNDTDAAEGDGDGDGGADGGVDSDNAVDGGGSMTSGGSADAGGADTDEPPMTGDDGTDPDTGGEPPITCDEPVDIQGVWLSEAGDVAPLLVELTNAASITGTFSPDTFTVLTIDGDGQMVNQSGVYTIEASGVGDIFNITLEQVSPQPVTAEGIFEIDNSVCPQIMQYEVVQTSPSVGAQAPTAALGFGGTNLGPDLTQTFVRQ